MLCPASLLRARRFCADPLALLPLSLPDARDRSALCPFAGAALRATSGRNLLAAAGRPSALRLARVPFLCRVAAVGTCRFRWLQAREPVGSVVRLGGNAKGFALSFPKQNSRPRVAVA